MAWCGEETHFFSFPFQPFLPLSDDGVMYDSDESLHSEDEDEDAFLSDTQMQEHKDASSYRYWGQAGKTLTQGKQNSLGPRFICLLNKSHATHTVIESCRFPREVRLWSSLFDVLFPR